MFIVYFTLLELSWGLAAKSARRFLGQGPHSGICKTLSQAKFIYVLIRLQQRFTNAIRGYRSIVVFKTLLQTKFVYFSHILCLSYSLNWSFLIWGSKRSQCISHYLNFLSPYISHFELHFREYLCWCFDFCYGFISMFLGLFLFGFLKIICCLICVGFFYSFCLNPIRVGLLCSLIFICGLSVLKSLSAM